MEMKREDDKVCTAKRGVWMNECEMVPSHYDEDGHKWRAGLSFMSRTIYNGNHFDHFKVLIHHPHPPSNLTAPLLPLAGRLIYYVLCNYLQIYHNRQNLLVTFQTCHAYVFCIYLHVYIHYTGRHVFWYFLLDK